MGLFDEIIIEKSLEDKWNNTLFKLEPILTDKYWQTKCLHCNMDQYILKQTDDGKIKLFLLEHPTKEDERYTKYWKEYTDQEIEERNKISFSFFHTEKGDGQFSDEAFWPQNRKHLSMGDLPHRILGIYAGTHNDKSWQDLELKFSDGVLTAIRRVYYNEKDSNGYPKRTETEWIKIL